MSMKLANLHKYYGAGFDSGFSGAVTSGLYLVVRAVWGWRALFFVGMFCRKSSLLSLAAQNIPEAGRTENMLED